MNQSTRMSFGSACLKCSRLLLVIVLSTLAGCASLNPEKDLKKVYEYNKSILPVTDDSVFDPDEIDVVSQRVAELLEGGLTADEAEQIAVLNNKEIEAAYFEIGISRAELVQSTTIGNPIVEATMLNSRDNDNTTYEASISFSLSEIWSLPLRKRIQHSRHEGKLLDVSDRIAVLISDTREAFNSAIASIKAREIEEINLASTSQLLELVLVKQELGATSTIEVNSAKAENIEQEIVLQSTLVEVNRTHRHLETILGLKLEQDILSIEQDVHMDLDSLINVDRLIIAAEANRPILRQLQFRVQAAEADIKLQKQLTISEFRGSLAVESKDGSLEYGPGVELEVPIFNRNRALISKAKYRLQQVRALYEAQRLQVRQEVYDAYHGALTALSVMKAYNDQIVPLRERNLELTRSSYLAGKETLVSVLLAQQELLDSRRAAVQSESQAFTAVTVLESVCRTELLSDK